MHRYKNSKLALENAEEDWLQRPETRQTTQTSMEQKKKQKTKMGRKITIWIFRATNKESFPCKNLRSLKRETESLLIAAKNNAIRTNVKAKIDKTQQNSRCWLYNDRTETINHIISEGSKLAQKEQRWLGAQGDPLGTAQEA